MTLLEIADKLEGTIDRHLFTVSTQHDGTDDGTVTVYWQTSENADKEQDIYENELRPAIRNLPIEEIDYHQTDGHSFVRFEISQ